MNANEKAPTKGGVEKLLGIVKTIVEIIVLAWKLFK